jgi:exosortase E/protease (VPEID-CTERM system)
LSLPARTTNYGLGARVLTLVVLFAAEAAVAGIYLDGRAPVPRGAWLTLLLHRRGALAVRCCIAFATLFATFAYLKYGPQLVNISKLAAYSPVRALSFVLHGASMAAFVLLSPIVYGGNVSAAASNLATTGWLIAASAAIASAALAILPWTLWAELARATGWLWAYSGALGFLAGWLFPWTHLLWQPTAKLTYSMVEFMGRPFFGDMINRPERMEIGTHRFSIIIAEECSGLEGIGLLLVFGLIWLILFRDEIRIGRALLLFPVGIVALFLLNSVRILALIAVGNAGARAIATGGLHSQAGWLAFNSVAFGLCVAARNLPWISTSPRHTTTTRSAHDSTTPLLAPFLAILAAGMISRAVSGTFEWGYALRFVAAAAALLVFRRQYAQLGWRPGWVAAGLGTLVFVLWVALDQTTSGAQPMPTLLSHVSPTARAAWIAARVLGAVVTVPIAEELAFRAYLLRRFISADFEAVGLKSSTWFALAASSVLFGLMHGSRWPAGILAGLIYAYAMLRRGRIGDAAVAHAVTNALLAAYVLMLGRWQFW